VFKLSPISLKGKYFEIKHQVHKEAPLFQIIKDLPEPVGIFSKSIFNNLFQIHLSSICHLGWKV